MTIVLTSIISLIVCFLCGMLWGESIGETLTMKYLKEEKENNNMGTVKEKIQISNCDYDELNSDNSRWTKEQYAYFAAKFKTSYAPEGYGMFGVRTSKDDNGRCYISWEHYDSCD